MRCPPSASAARNPAFSLPSRSCDSTSALIARSSRSKSLDFEAVLEMKRSPVLLRSYRGTMEYVKRLSNKEAAESGEPEDGRRRIKLRCDQSNEVWDRGAKRPSVREVDRGNW
jgi:hypothetical protein